jgi:hypothetical protein
MGLLTAQADGSVRVQAQSVTAPLLAWEPPS